MKLTEATKDDLMGELKTKKVIEEFLETGYDYAKVDFTAAEYSTAMVAAAAIKRWARKLDAPVSATVRAGNLYMINTDNVEL